MMGLLRLVLTSGLLTFLIPCASAQVRVGGELVELLVRGGSKLPHTELEAAVRATARVSKLNGHTVTEAQWLQLGKWFDELPESRLTDESLLALLLRTTDSQRGDHIVELAKLYPHRETGKFLAVLGALPRGDVLLESLAARKVSIANGDLTLRGIAGRQLSRAQIVQIDGAWRAVGDDVWGHLFEEICRRQISRGTMAGKLPLRRGAVVIEGKCNSAGNGLDGIAPCIDGSPCVFEFTVSARKSAGLTEHVEQLSVEGVAKRWNQYLATENGVTALRELGIADKYLEPVTSEVVRLEFARKLVVSDPDQLSELSRQRWGLGINDCLALNQ